MTSGELIERAIRLLGPETTVEQRLHLRSTLLANVETALRRLAEMAAPKNLLRKTFTVTATDGEASLTTPLAAAEPLLLDHLSRASIFITGFTMAAQYKADRSSLSYAATTQFPYYTLENQTLVIRDATGLDNYNGTVTLRNAPYIPLLTNVPASLETLLVELLAATVLPKPEEKKERRERRAS